MIPASDIFGELESHTEELLREKGYQIIRKIGEGNTRNVYEVEYKSGSLAKRRVAKIPKLANEQSPTTLINLSKGDPDQREVLALNEISHPNIVEIYDAIKIGDRTITIEEHYDAISLEELIEISGPIKSPEKFKQIFSQIYQGLKHLHLEEGLLHRDIKPNNILVGKKNSYVKLTDLQNAGSLEDITASLLPTRGATAFTDFYVLNDFIEKKETKTNISSEFYALGATMYFALTGEELFDRALVFGEEGSEININGKQRTVVLKEEGKPIYKIDPNRHNKELKKKLKKVPKQYRKLLWGCLSSFERDYTEAHQAHWKFEAYFEEATRSRISIQWEKVRNNATLFSLTAGILTGLIGGGYWTHVQEQNRWKTEPTIMEMLSSDNFRDSSIEFIINDTNKPTLETLIPYFKEINERVDPINHSINDETTFFIDKITRQTGMSRRMVYSLIRSSLMESPERIKEEYNGEHTRMLPTLVEKQFLLRHLKTDSPGVNLRITMETPQIILYGTKNLKYCIGTNQSIADVYACYFSNSLDEIFWARSQAGNTNFFPSEKEIETEGPDKRYKEVPGYGDYLKPIQKDLISRALALYYITDNTGKVHLELLDDNNQPIKGLEDK